MSGPIVVPYAEMHNASATFRAGAREIEQKLADLYQRLQRMQWSGDDAAAYHMAQQDINSALQRLNGVLDSMGRAVEIAAENYRNTELANARTFGG